MRAALRAACACLGLANLLAAPRARAQSAEPRDLGAAQTLFDSAMEHLKSGAVERACPELEEVVRLVPDGLGARLRLAECYERAGRTASAWTTYTMSESLAKLKGQVARAAYAQEHAALLKPRLVRLAIVVSDAVRGIRDLRVMRDGREIAAPEWGIGVPVDPGPHTVSASAAAREAWQSTALVREGGGDVVIAVPELAPAPVPASIETGHALPVAPPPTRTPTWVWLTGSGGLASMGIAIGFAVDQQATQSRIDKACPTSVSCTGGFDARGANGRLYRDFGLFLGFGIAGVLATVAAVVGLAAAPKGPSAAPQAPRPAISRGPRRTWWGGL
jgi:hypothetical protein